MSLIKKRAGDDATVVRSNQTDRLESDDRQTSGNFSSFLNTYNSLANSGDGLDFASLLNRLASSGDRDYNDLAANLFENYLNRLSLSEQRSYDDPSAQVARLMAAGMSREAALAAIQGGSDPTLSSGLTAPSQTALNDAQADAARVQSVVAPFSAAVGLASLGVSAPGAILSAGGQMISNQVLAMTKSGLDAASSFASVAEACKGSGLISESSTPDAYTSREGLISSMRSIANNSLPDNASDDQRSAQLKAQQFFAGDGYSSYLNNVLAQNNIAQWYDSSWSNKSAHALYNQINANIDATFAKINLDNAQALYTQVQTNLSDLQFCENSLMFEDNVARNHQDLENARFTGQSISANTNRTEAETKLLAQQHQEGLYRALIQMEAFDAVSTDSSKREALVTAFLNDQFAQGAQANFVLQVASASADMLENDPLARRMCALMTTGASAGIYQQLLQQHCSAEIEAVKASTRLTNTTTGLVQQQSDSFMFNLISDKLNNTLNSVSNAVKAPSSWNGLNPYPLKTK